LNLNPAVGLLTPAIGLAWVAVAYAFWRVGLRHYEGTGIVRRTGFLTAAAGAALTAALPRRARAASLEETVSGITASVPGVVGVYARTLSDAPPLVALNADESFPAASTIKC